MQDPTSRHANTEQSPSMSWKSKRVADGCGLHTNAMEIAIAILIALFVHQTCDDQHNEDATETAVSGTLLRSKQCTLFTIHSYDIDETCAFGNATVQLHRTSKL